MMWIDVGKLIRDRVPDKTGKTLPPDLSAGSYEIRDLTDPGIGTLFEGKVTYDKTYGHVTYGCANCCAYHFPYLGFNPLGFFVGGQGINGVEANDTCGGIGDNISSYFANNWTTASQSIATVAGSGYHTGVGAGATTSSTHGIIASVAPRTCPVIQQAASGGDNVSPNISSISPSRGLLGNSISVTIAGLGFNGSGLSVSAGSDISVTINSHSSTQIQATFAINVNASSGNHSVTVTAGGKTSSAANFYVQIPKTMVRDTSYGTGGLGPLVTITNGNVLDIAGQILLTNECGVYRNIAYFLVDQETPPMTIQGNYTLVEHFTNYTTSVNGLTVPPDVDNSIVYAQIRQGDIQFFGTRAPSCPGANDHEGFDQHLTVQLDSSHSYGLSMVNHVDRGYYSGTATVNVTITTP